MYCKTARGELKHNMPINMHENLDEVCGFWDILVYRQTKTLITILCSHPGEEQQQQQQQQQRPWRDIQ